MTSVWASLDQSIILFQLFNYQDMRMFVFRPGKTSVKKLLKGHINKVTCVHFSGDSRSINTIFYFNFNLCCSPIVPYNSELCRHAVSGSLDGKLIVWDCWTGNKTQVIPLRFSYIFLENILNGTLTTAGLPGS